MTKIIQVVNYRKAQFLKIQIIRARDAHIEELMSISLCICALSYAQMDLPALSPKLQKGKTRGFCEIAQPLWSLIQKKNLRLQLLQEFLNLNELKIPNSVLTTFVPRLQINKLSKSNSFSDITAQSFTHRNEDTCSHGLE